MKTKWKRLNKISTSLEKPKPKRNLGAPGEFCRTCFWCVTFLHLRFIIIIIILCCCCVTLCNIACICIHVNWLRVRDLSSFKGSAINIRHPHCFIFWKPCLCCSILYVIFALRHECLQLQLFSSGSECEDLSDEMMGQMGCIYCPKCCHTWLALCMLMWQVCVNKVEDAVNGDMWWMRKTTRMF